MLKSKTKFARQARKRDSALSLQPSAFACSAFTLLEMLVVIAILGIIAGLTVPVLKNFAKSDATLGASRQLLDGVARARQLAISRRTTVYMVFVPTNFWIDSSGTFPNSDTHSWWGNLASALQTAVTNLADRQLSGYNFLAYGAMGDQPGQHPWHYLDRWQNLPENTFIAWAKFTNSPGLPGQPYTITDLINPNKPGTPYQIWGFHVTNNFPFPTETGTNVNPPRITVGIILPYIAFNYLGQLTFDGQTLADRDEYIPIAKGNVVPAINPATKSFVLPSASPPSLPRSPQVSETPPGNSTDSYNIVHIDRLTGRAVLEFQKMAP
ncbi:MAG: prepilin-type N-terminal cleavage/methylation domain-containing protein [Verrucomicrobiota bacterium]|jgi:prepilin-type N-terminal cleavage/methylation domain-containing protein